MNVMNKHDNIFLLMLVSAGVVVIYLHLTGGYFSLLFIGVDVYENTKSSAQMCTPDCGGGPLNL